MKLYSIYRFVYIGKCLLFNETKLFHHETMVQYMRILHNIWLKAHKAHEIDHFQTVN